MNTKVYIYALSLATVLLGMASCANDEVQDVTEKTSSLELRTEIAETRAIIEGTQFSENDVIQLVLQGTANNVSSCTATLKDGQWVLDREVLLNKNRIGIGGFFNVASSIAPNEKGDQTDILVGMQVLQDGMAVNVDNPHAYIQFQHLLSRVSFDIQQVNGTGHLSQLALVNLEKGSAIGTNLNFDYLADFGYSAISQISQMGLLAGRSYSPTEKLNQINEYDKMMATLLTEMSTRAHYMREGNSPLVMPTNVQLVEAPTTVSLLAIPTTINSYSRVALQLTIDGKTYQVEIPAVQWNGNYHYRYPVVIDLSHDKLVPITIGNYSIEGWGAATSLSGVEQTVPMD